MRTSSKLLQGPIRSFLLLLWRGDRMNSVSSLRFSEVPRSRGRSQRLRNSRRCPSSGISPMQGRKGTLVLLQAFRQGLAETGYVEGRNVATEYRSAEGDADGSRALPPTSWPK